MNWSLDDVPVVAGTALTFVPRDGSDPIVFDDVARRLHRLPGPTATIWAAIDSQRTLSAVVDLVAALHGADVADVTADVVRAVEQLAALGLVQRT